MEEYINADPITYEHHKLFEYLQRQCLDWRLLDPYASLVSIPNNYSVLFILLPFLQTVMITLNNKMSLRLTLYFQGWFTPGQMFVLDEYCARYGVRGCYRHLKYMEDLLEKCEKNVMIDPTLFHLSYAYCASHVHGNR